MLKRKYRIGKDFNFTNARAFSSPFFTMKIRENEFLYPRFGIVVSKKTEILSVGRNRVRRLLSSCLGKLQKELLSGYDFLFIIKKEMIGKSQSVICDMVNGVFKDAGFAL